MTIASEITRIKTNIADAYTALEEKGAAMPEVQNSDGLAKTIGSISTGTTVNNDYEHRNGWLVPQLYRDIDSLIENYPNNLADFFEVGSSSNMLNVDMYISGYVLNNDVNDVTLFFQNNSSYKYILLPSDVTIEKTDLGNESYRKVRFKTERWIIAVSSVNNFDYPMHFINGASLGNQNAYLNFVKYISFKRLSNSYNKFSFNCMGACLVDDIHVIGDYESSYNINYQNILNVITFKNPKCITNIYKVPTIEDTSDTWNGQTLSYIGNAFAQYYKANLLDFVHFPIILDLSAYTKTSELVLGRGESGGATRLKHLEMILPSTCSVKIANNSNGIMYNPILDIESYRFIAEHAPVVSEKNFTIGTLAKKYCNAVDPTIISTLEDKGWTVS